MKPFVSLPNTKKTYFPFDDDIIKEEIIEDESLITSKNIDEPSTSGSSQNNIIHIPFKQHVKNYYSEFNIINNNNILNNNNVGNNSDNNNNNKCNDFPFIKPKSNDEIHKINKNQKNNNDFNNNNSKKNLPEIKRPLSSRNKSIKNNNNILINKTNYNTKKVEKELNCLINNIPQNLLDDPEINKKFNLIMKNIDELKQCVNNKTNNFYNNNNNKIQQKKIIYNKKCINKIYQPPQKKK